MRLISTADAKTLESDPKAEVKTFYVENAKGNTIPKHFTAEENKDQKVIKINGVDTKVSRNKERSEYVAFCIGEGETAKCHYIRDHEFLDHSNEYITFVRPKPEPKPKKEKVKKADAAEGAADGSAEGTTGSTETADAPKGGGKKKGAAAEKAAREAREAAKA